MGMFCLSGSTFERWGKAFAFPSLLFIFTIAGPAIRAQEEGDRLARAFAILGERGEIIIEFSCGDSATLKHISSFLSIDRRTPGGFIAYASEAGFRTFLGYDIPFRIIERKARQKSDAIIADFPGNWDAYPAYSQYVGFMKGIAGSHPGICRLDTIGMSVDGRSILAMKITDRPGEREPEPAFVWSSTIHGDETTGFMLLLHLIDYLCSGYGNDSLVTRLVDSIEIWINPLANPDGTYWPAADVITLPRRFNSNDVDLNRNFPGLNDPGHPDNHPYQPENLAQMSFLSRVHMVMGANIHGGEEVVNYPFDSWEQLHADDAWYRLTSREYADLARERAFPLLYMNALDSGITNGWKWYQVEGSRQDWVNYYNRAREVTLEISRDKDPPPGDLPYYWYYNYPSILRYMEQSIFGIQGTVRDRSSGEPLKAAVRVQDHDRLNSEVNSDSLTGYFARLIEPGTWDLEFSAPGYETFLASGIRVEAGRATRIKVSLNPWATAAGEGTVTLASPNPFFDGTVISFPDDGPGRYIILIFDLNGRLVRRADLTGTPAGDLVYPLDGSGLGTGMYLLKVVTPSGSRTQKIFKSQWK
jgi:hypothetical protein